MFSQSLEEKYILEYFGDHIGTFISLGENDGETFSNVRALALKGWKGCCVEPSPKAFERLKKLYQGDKNVLVYQYAIGDHNGSATLLESGPLCTPNDVGLVSTFHFYEQDRFKKTVDYQPVEVKMLRWKTFKNRLPIKKFDFVSCDTEGNDIEILSQMDLTDVKCICLEWNGVPNTKIHFEKYLTGFKVLYTSGENVLYGR